MTTDPIETQNEVPKVTQADVEAMIAAEYTLLASDAVGPDVPIHPALKLMTLCIIVLRNGFKIVGTSACASPLLFDAEIGRTCARADAIRQIWPLAGYELLNKLAGQI